MSMTTFLTIWAIIMIGIIILIVVLVALLASSVETLCEKIDKEKNKK